MSQTMNCTPGDCFIGKNLYFSKQGKLVKLENCKTVEKKLTEISYDLFLQVEAVIISSSSLFIVPNIIFSFKNLTHLKLNNNCLENLPNEIKSLRNLRSLDLQGNNLNSLPSSLQYVHQLNYLNVSHNKFTEVPNVLYYSLRLLKVLDMSFNEISDFSYNPACLNELIELRLSNNVLSHIPSWVFGSVCQLKTLDLCQNNLNLSLIRNVNYFSTGVYDTLLVLNLENCNCNYERLQFLCYFKNIEVLFLGNKKNSYIKNREINYFGNLKMDILKNLSKLEKLHIQNAQISTIPLDINYLENVRILDLSRNMLSWLPENFCDLVCLTIIHLEYNHLLYLPSNIDKLVNLKQIHLESNKLNDLPVSFKNLHNLEFIDLYGNEMREIDLCAFLDKNLKGLDLEMNCIDVGSIKCNSGIHDIMKEYNDLKNNFRKHFNCLHSRSDFQMNTNTNSDNEYCESYSSNTNSVSFSEDENFSICEDLYFQKFDQIKIQDEIDWDATESCKLDEDDLFDPNCLRFSKPYPKTVSVSSDFQNNYCPSYSHVKSIVKMCKKNLKLALKSEIVEGQFDSD